MIPLLVLLLLQYKQYKVIYRRYAGLFFSMCVDVTDNELLLLESIHVFVELLDRYFGNVCELDLVFNFHKVYTILDEYILSGEIQVWPGGTGRVSVVCVFCVLEAGVGMGVRSCAHGCVCAVVTLSPVVTAT